MFIDSAVFICDFHCCQAWERWFSIKENGYAGVKGDIICKFRRMAVSMTGEECDKAIEDLKSLSIGMESYRNTWKHTGYPSKRCISLFH